jgi:hypothetical protein
MAARRDHGGMPDPRQPKITFGELRSSGVTGILVYCADYKCSHMVPIDSAQWPDDVRLSDIENRFVCEVCGKRGADVRPDWKSVESFV